MQVHNLIVRAKGKALLESTSLMMSQGQRYGLAGLSVWLDQHKSMPMVRCRCTI